MKINQYIVSLLILAFTAVSCQDYLTVLPENNQSTVQYWNTKEDVESVLGAGYIKLRDAQENIFLWGEARGNGIYFGFSGTKLQNESQKLRQFDILATNEMAKWDKLYAIINMANSVIKYAPTVHDASFNVNVMRSYISEAYFQRALAYFYLVRLWGDVPYITEPYVDDSAPYDIAQTSGDEILAKCIVELNNSIESAKSRFPETDATNPINTKGRATKWSIYSLVADMNLWLGNYDECISACNEVINSGQVGLISGINWFGNFFPGNSNESIYEIQYSYTLGQTNSFLSWFFTNRSFYISPYTQFLFEANPTDIRGLNSSYSAAGYAWKYVGINSSSTTTRSASLQNDQNFIVYRLAEIYLMQAEAYIMKGGEENMALGLDLINAIKKRANVPESAGSNEKLEMIKILLEERQREFFCEGKNWFDLVRIGSRDEVGFKQLFIEQVLQVSSASTMAMNRAILEDMNSWYLPINNEELETNRLLVQNPYYENLGN